MYDPGEQTCGAQQTWLVHVPPAILEGGHWDEATHWLGGRHVDPVVAQQISLAFVQVPPTGLIPVGQFEA